MTTKRSFKIAPFCTNVQFLKYDLADAKKGDWVKAVKVFNDRFNSRYFIPINHLLRLEEEYSQDGWETTDQFHPGFITLSIDFVLLETLNQFRYGINDSMVAFHNKCAFAELLLSNPKLSTYFTTAEEAYNFYWDVRCGLVHQGQTKGSSKINRSKTFIENHYKTGANGFDVNRTMFHQVVVDEYLEYSSAIANLDTRDNDDLRNKFRDKMFFLCGENLPQASEKKCRFCGKKL